MSEVYLDSMCTVELIGWAPTAFGLIYEGAIGRPRWTTSLCDLLYYLLYYIYSTFSVYSVKYSVELGFTNLLVNERHVAILVQLSYTATGPCIFSSAAFTPLHAAVFGSNPAISLLLVKTVSQAQACLSYDWRGFLGPKKKTIVGLSVWYTESNM